MVSDWTKELFEEHPQLFLGAFEKRLSQTPEEVNDLLGYLEQQGFKPRRLLDLNCGIGRHSTELAKRGIEVVGTDLSRLYIETAQKRAEKEGVSDKVRFLVADMRRIASVLRSQGPFDGIINLWTSFGFYDDNTNDDILRQCRKLVRDGGFFVLDIVNRDWLVRHFQKRGFSRSGEVIILEERELSLNDSRMYDTWTFLRDKGDGTFALESEIKLNHRVWSLHELIQMLARTGWLFRQAHAGFPRSTSDVSLMEVRQLLVIAERQRD
jgi:SAM-dependent methyltransferase